MQSFVNGVVGLQNVHVPHLLYREYTGGATNAVTGHQPTDFPSIYGADSLPVRGGRSTSASSRKAIWRRPSLRSIPSLPQNGFPP